MPEIVLEPISVDENGIPQFDRVKERPSRANIYISLIGKLALASICLFSVLSGA